MNLTGCPGLIVDQPMLAHKAVHEAHVAAEVIAGELQGNKVKKGLFPWTASGRAIANGRDEGVTKLLFDDSSEANCHGIRTLHHSYCATG